MAKRDYLRVEELVFCNLPYWGNNGRQLVRIAKRRRGRRYTGYEYFVTAPGSPTGYGVWVEQDKLVALSPIEQLALTWD